MKVLALLIVMANIVFFLWEYHSGGALHSDKALQVPESTRLQPILLVQEVRQKHESQSAWHAEAITERFPFVSDYLLTQVAKAEVDAESYHFLLAGPVTVPWSQPLAEAAAEIAKNSSLAGLLDKAPRTTTEAKAQTSELFGRQAPLSTRQHESATITVSEREHEHSRTETAVSVASAHAGSGVSQNNLSEIVKAAPLSVCYEAGPFDNRAVFEQWRRRSGIASTFITQVQHDEQAITGYLVYYPAPDTFDQALANVEMLKKKGINDLWLFRQGEFKGEISLGLFKNEERAKKLEEQLLAKGLNVKVKPRLKSTAKLYAQIRIAQELEVNLIANRNLWQKQHAEFVIKVSKNCAMKPDASQE